MKLTNKQKKDIETIMMFIPDTHKNVEITEKDKADFQAYSTHGVLPKGKKQTGKLDMNIDGFTALIHGKRLRGLHMELWEDGVMEGTTPYYTLLQNSQGKIPKSLKEFMKKEMFKGVDSELIENVYTSL